MNDVKTDNQSRTETLRAVNPGTPKTELQPSASFRKKEIKLAVIGGGSSQWMISLMRDVYLLDEIEGGEICLVDPKTEHVQAVAEMLQAFNRTRNKTYRISVMENRKEALVQADFVLTTFSPGSMDSFENDLEIPLKYGIFQPVSMTVGPCGISAAIRTAPVAYEIVEEMEQLCPGAWLLNVTNPMSVVTRAMNLAARTVKVVGMCHEVHALPHYLTETLGIKWPEGVSVLDFMYRWLAAEGYEYTIAGVNHCPWLTEIRHHGEDLIPTIHRYCTEHWGKDTRTAKYAMCRTFGYLPLAGDRHLVEFWPSLCNVRNGFAKGYGVRKTTVDSRRHGVERSLDQVRRIARGEEQISWNQSAEELTEIMRAILNETTTVATVNLPNCGQITNMPREVVVETLATISAKGVAPKFCGELPGSVGTLMRLHADIHELTLRASLEGNREFLVQALSLDPLSAQADFSEIGQLADDLLNANRAWLPRFF